MRILQLGALCAFFALQLPALAAQVSFVSTAKQAGLLELFSSEGCSSCPPADRWLSSLKSRPELWIEIIPVAFHVDYWDYIGWQDRFANREYTRRQQRYAQEKSIGAVYTPGFVYNGGEWRQWFKTRKLRFPMGKNTGVLRADIQDSNVNISFAPSEKPADELIASVALLGFDLTTAVQAGENQGRKLQHDFVVLGFRQAKLSEHRDIYSTTTNLPATSVEAPKLGIAIWISRSSHQGPLQAVGGWLAESK